MSVVPSLRRCPAEVLHLTLSDPQRQKPRETMHILKLKADSEHRAASIALHHRYVCLALRTLALAWALGSTTYRASCAGIACASLHSSPTFLTNASDVTHVFKPNVLREAYVSDRMTSRADGFRHRGGRGCCPLDAQKVLHARGFRNEITPASRACASVSGCARG